MKQYLLGVHSDESASMTDEQMQAAFKAVDAFNRDLMQTGAWVFAGGLEPLASSSVVRAQGGEVIVTDGPFAETKEQIGGFWVVRAADLDTAFELAARGSRACGWPVEVRPFQAMPEV
ncbi:MAG TPA: YciI family protein [Trebonia sp.]